MVITLTNFNLFLWLASLVSVFGFSKIPGYHKWVPCPVEIILIYMDMDYNLSILIDIKVVYIEVKRVNEHSMKFLNSI